MSSRRKEATGNEKNNQDRKFRSWGLSRVVVAKQCLLNSRTARYGSGQKGGKEEEGRKEGKECIKMF